MKTLRTIICSLFVPVVLLVLARESGLLQMNVAISRHAKFCIPVGQPIDWLRDAERIDLVARGRLVRSENVAGTGENGITVRILASSTNWSLSQYVPLFKQGTTDFYVIYEVVGENQQRSYELVQLSYDTQVIGACSSLAYREELREDVSNTIMAQLKHRILKVRRSTPPTALPLAAVQGSAT